MRKQPKRLTPPLFLHGNSGAKEVVEVDQELVLQEIMRSTRTTAIIYLSDGLRVQVSSRCMNKRRYPVLWISPAGYTPPTWQPMSPTFKEIKNERQSAD